MQLKTYPQLNLPTKRLGIDTDDWLWILGSFLPGLIFINFNGAVGTFLFITCPLVMIVWAALIKPSKPRGWLGSVIDYLLRNGLGIRPIIYKAELESYDGPCSPRY